MRCAVVGIATKSDSSLHVPLPPPEILTSLPNHEKLISLLMQYDVVGFQTDGDVQNFVRYLISECDQMRQIRVFETAGRHVTLSVNGQQTLVGSFPVGIEPRAFSRLARRNEQSPPVKNSCRKSRWPQSCDRSRSSGLFQGAHPPAGTNQRRYLKACLPMAPWLPIVRHGDFGTPPSFKQLFGQASACRYTG